MTIFKWQRFCSMYCLPY